MIEPDSVAQLCAAFRLSLLHVCETWIFHFYHFIFGQFQNSDYLCAAHRRALL